jgi:hypothetical protein
VKKVIHAVYQTRSGEMCSTHCGKDITKMDHAGFQDEGGNRFREAYDMDVFPYDKGITCKLCLRKNHGATRSQPTA